MHSLHSRLTGLVLQDTSDIYQSTPGGHKNEHLVGEIGHAPAYVKLA